MAVWHKRVRQPSFSMCRDWKPIICKKFIEEIFVLGCRDWAFHSEIPKENKFEGVKRALEKRIVPWLFLRSIWKLSKEREINDE